MTSPTWILVDELDEVRTAAGQMAADVALLEAAAADGTPRLRLYRWHAPALSLGRFQPDNDVDADACERLGVEVVRRPTGGRALLHGSDLTYAVALPVALGERAGVDATYGYLATALCAGLAQLGVRAAVARHDGPSGAVCMATQQGADLRVGERKVCGSAQVQRGGGVLQHGSILLDRLAFDETDLVVGEHDRGALHAATVTLAELGAPHDARIVADAVVDGFRVALEIDFTLESRSTVVTSTPGGG